MKLSQTNGGLFDFYSTEEETVKHLHDAGFCCMDVSFFERFTKGSEYWDDGYLSIAGRYREALKKYGMTAVQSHEPVGNYLGDDDGEYALKKTKRAIRLAGEIGIPSITIHPGTSNDGNCSFDEFMTKNVERISQLLPLAEEYGMYLLIENVGNAFGKMKFYVLNADVTCELCDAFHHELVAVNLDIGHNHDNGNDPYDAVVKCGKRLKGLHIHDNHGVALYPDGTGRSDQHLMPYSGNLNYEKFIRGLIDVGYDGTFNFEVGGLYGNRDNPKLTPEIRLAFDRLLYHIGRNMLESYGVFDG